MAKYKKKDGSVSKDNAKCIEKYFLAVLKPETQYPTWDTVALHKEIVKEFCVYFYSEIEIMRTEKNAKKLTPVITWLSSGRSEAPVVKEVESTSDVEKNDSSTIATGSAPVIENKPWDFNRVSCVLKDLSEKVASLGVEHRTLQKKKEELSTLNKGLSESLISTKELLSVTQQKLNDAEATVAQQSSKIDELDAEIAKLSSIVSVYAEDKQSSMDGQLNAIASKLKSEYKEFQDALEAEMTAEIGEIVRDQLHRVFKILIKAGIDIEGR